MKKILVLLALLFSVTAYGQNEKKNLYLIDDAGHLIMIGAPAGMTSNTTITFPTTGGTVLTSASSGGTYVTNFGDATNAGQLNIYDGSGNYIQFKSASSLGTNGTYTWPLPSLGVLTSTATGDVDITKGTGNQVLGMNAGGTALEWKTLSSVTTTPTYDNVTVGAAGTQGYVRLYDGAASPNENYINLQVASTLAGNWTYSVPDAGANASFLLSTSISGQTIGGGFTVNGGLTLGTALTAVNGGTGLSTFAKGSLLYASSTNTWAALASASADGNVLSWNNTTGLPEWRLPASSFSSSLAVTSTTNQLNLGDISGGNGVTISSVAPASGDLTYTIPDAGTNASFVMTEGTQTINGTKTIPSLNAKDGATGLTLYNATDNTKKAQLDASAIATGTTRTYTLPDASGTLALVGTTQNNATNFSSLGVNIGTSSPSTTVEVNGDVAYRATTNGTAATSFNDVSTSTTSNVRFTGATADFTVSGFANGYNGKKLHIYNATSHGMTFANNSGSSSAGNKILTMAGGDVTLEPAGSDGNSADLTYDAAALSGNGAWILQGAETYRTTGVVASGTAYQILSSNQNSTTTDPSTMLTFSVVAGATYEIRGTIQMHIGGTSSNGLYLGLNPSSGSLTNVSLSQMAFTPSTGNTAIKGIAFNSAGGTAGEQTFNSGQAKNSDVDILVNGIFTASATGTVDVIYHWVTGNGSTDYVKSNSYLSCTRVN